MERFFSQQPHYLLSTQFDLKSIPSRGEQFLAFGYFGVCHDCLVHFLPLVNML